MVRTVPVSFVASLLLVASSGVQASDYEHLVAKHAAAHGVPESLVRRVIHIESKGNPRVVSKGNYGLMQIRLGTARAMGYTGGADGLLDADTNMNYAVKYLAGAYRVARGNHSQAIRHYQRGYYYQAKAMGVSPYDPAPATQQAAAPDPAMLKDAEDRRRAARAQHAAAEQQRQAALQLRADERQRAAAARAEKREAALRERAEKREAILRERAERKRAAEERRAAQRAAAVQGRAEREQARQPSAGQPAKQQAALQAAVEQDKIEEAQRIELQRSERSARNRSAAASTNAAGAAASRSPRRAGAETEWYSPMRFFKHPAHKAHPYKAAESVR